MGYRFWVFAIFSFLSFFPFAASSPAIEPNITYYLSEFPPFLGADVATSIPLSTANGTLALWLFGDTITGEFVSGHRSIEAMPRNSVGLLFTNSGVPQSVLSHFIRYATDPATSNHTGFWSPDEDTHWFFPPAVSLRWMQCAHACSRYWPTSGFDLNGTVFVFAMNMKNFEGGLFPFALSSESSYNQVQSTCASVGLSFCAHAIAGVDVIRVTTFPISDPFQWCLRILLRSLRLARCLLKLLLFAKAFAVPALTL